MFRVMKLMLIVAVSLALAVGTAVAQGYRDAGAKTAGNFGTGFHSGGMRSAQSYRGAPIYSAAPAPMVAPPASEIAQAPTDRRSFSAEPSQAQAAPMAPQVIRSYSYEPAPVYRAPARSRSATPSFLLPRTDPRKHGG